MKTSRQPGLAARFVEGSGHLRHRVQATFSRAQLGPSRETELRAFLPRR
jgi:hypothetical protein